MISGGFVIPSVQNNSLKTVHSIFQSLTRYYLKGLNLNLNRLICLIYSNEICIRREPVLSAKLLKGFYATTQMIRLTLTLYTIEKKLYGEQPNSVACVVIVFLVSSPRLTNNTLNSSSNFRQEHPGKNNPQMHGITSLSPLCSLPLF